MAMGLVGRKCGMTRVFTKTGTHIPVTVIEILPNHITQIKTSDTDGYNAIQITTGVRRPSRVNKPLVGHFSKAGVEPGRGLWEFRLPNNAALDQYKLGDALPIEYFSEGQKVDVTAISKGKGFAGTIKRHNFSMQDATHGNSRAHRASGSIGQNQDPGRVFKGKKMAGQMGNVKTTVQSLEVIRVDAQHHMMLVKGALPGPTGGDVIIVDAVKAPTKKQGDGNAS